MTFLKSRAAQWRTISFDCYGTLIDWVSGISAVFRALADSGSGLLPADERAFFDAYLHAEARAESGSYKSYRDVLRTVLQRLAGRYELPLDSGQQNLLVDSHANWRPFPDTNSALQRLSSRYRLGILSNVDRDLFAATARHFEIAFDFIITADDVRSYKPARGHFDRLLKTVASDRKTHLHVAQSLFHDGVPTAEFDIPFVWINRRREANRTEACPLAVFNDLAELADALSV